MEAEDPGGPDDGFKLPEPEDDDWDREARVAAGFSNWDDSEGSRRLFHKDESTHKFDFS